MQSTQVAIIGGGLSGLGVAERLRRAGIDDFLLLEKSTRLGGTWRDNTYPGCACDVPSVLYSFSFAPSTEWSRVFAPQAEIQAYTLDVAQRIGVEPHLRLGTALQEARWDDTRQRWQLQTSTGPLEARVLVAAPGPLHTPQVPALPGLESFAGEHFHSARWRHDLDLRGRRVAVIGTGSSAIQFVPEIQPEVTQLTVFQRTAPWVLPKLDHAIPGIERFAFRHIPGFQRGLRGSLYYALELLQLAQRRPAIMRRLQALAERHLRKQVPDPELRARLTPDFVLGCKRLLLSNTWYPALQQDNASVVSAGVQKVRPDGVVDAAGDFHPCDTIIFGTGFQVSEPPFAQHVHGRDGASLAGTWQGSPHAYKGTTIPGFPNFFLMLGPNLGNGHSSATVIIEAQAEYIADAVAQMRTQALASVEVRADVESRWNEKIQADLQKTVWNAGGCASWYLDAQGTNRAIYPWSTLDLRRRLQRFDLERYHRRRQLVVAITGGAQGIGRAVARDFAAEGATVCVGDLDEAGAQRTAAEVGGRGFALDVSDRESFRRFIETIEEEVGPIDVLVNNAGVMPTGAFLEEHDAVEKVAFGVNYRGVASGLRLVLPHMLKRNRGHVVNIASMAGKLHMAGSATYVASKHAVVGLSASVREEIKDSQVSITTILPGPVKTQLSEGIPLNGLFAIEPEEVSAAVLGSWREPEDEIAVPRWMSVYTPAAWALPPRTMGWIRKRLGAGRILTDVDAGRRRRYEAEIVAQDSNGVMA